MKGIVRSVVIIGIALVLAYVVTHFIGMRAVVHGASMEPALSDQDQLIVDKMSYLLGRPKRYDIVVCPGVPEEDGNTVRRPLYIKRIIGLPGETIGIEDGKVLIDGQILEDDIYGKDSVILQSDEAADMLLPGSYTLQEDEYFLMGDNRNDSRDSRDPMLGPVARKELIGKVLLRISPWSKAGIVR